jgi:hypothetical protein
MLHWTQLVRSKRLAMYDYGDPDKNIQAYGSPEPPPYRPEVKYLSTLAVHKMHMCTLELE